MTTSELLTETILPRTRSAVRLGVSGFLWIFLRAALPRIIQIILEVLATEIQNQDTTAKLAASLATLPMSSRLPEVRQAAPESDA